MRRAEIATLLPTVFQLALDPVEGTGLEPDRRLATFLDVMEAFHQPMEDTLDRLDAHLDPRRAPAAFVAWLCGWLDLDWLIPARAPGDPEPEQELLSTGLGRLRELVALAAELSTRRGTAAGLGRFLEVATGRDDLRVDDDARRGGAGRPFHVVIDVPADALPMRPLIERIAAAELPAYVTWELRTGIGA
jgi:phage tail-like protein